MLSVFYLMESGVVSFYVLLYFCECMFVGVEGCLCLIVLISNDNVVYELEDE